MEVRKKGGEWRIALRVRTQTIMKHSSKLERGGHMNENAIDGAPKKGEEWRIALRVCT